MLTLSRCLRLRASRSGLAKFFTRQLAEGFTGWLGLNRAKQPEGFELNPVVGVRCQELEYLLSTLLKEATPGWNVGGDPAAVARRDEP
jgi:hypothetical protein